MPDAKNEALTKMRNLISTGIVYEDEFVEKYFNILQDEDFMTYFGEKRSEAERLFNSMIEESKKHKEGLQSIYEKLS
jgi:hypothetical protein